MNVFLIGQSALGLDWVNFLKEVGGLETPPQRYELWLEVE